VTRAVTQPARYGSKHQKLRRVVAREVATGSVACARCGRRIEPWEDFDLDHADDGSGYLGASHQGCNRDTSSKRAVRSEDRLDLDKNGIYQDARDGFYYQVSEEKSKRPRQVSRRW
jgi:hypothetical protein